jgi:hypothetical protein
MFILKNSVKGYTRRLRFEKKHTIDVFDCVYVCLYVMNKLIIVFPLVRFRNWQIVV